MIAPTAPRRYQVGTYNNGQPYVPARGRYAPREGVEDRLRVGHPMVDLAVDRLVPSAFICAVVREMKIRFYQRKTVKAYRNALTGMLRWFGRPPHLLTREDVRDYLEFLVDAGASASWVGINLSAIRTAFDKMCRQTVTLGLETPRRPKRLPVILSPQEVMRLLQAAPSLRDKLLLGMMYATGMRVSEVARLRWRDIDFDRRVVNIWQGKGRTDRQVMLPVSFEPLLQELSKTFDAEDYVFPGERRGRHLSPRSIQRAMQRAVQIAGIGKRATCHTLRHCFATHLFEHGTDIRYIQKLLGHAKLETTTIYTRVAVIRQQQVRSPLDALTGKASRLTPKSRPVGRMQIKLTSLKGEEKAARVKVTILDDDRFVHLEGITVREPRPGWVVLDVPPLEAWEKPLAWLPIRQRERVESPDFYQLLQTEISRRYLALRVGKT